MKFCFLRRHWSEGDIGGNYFCISGKTGARNKDPKKYHKDAAILEKAYLEQDNLPLWLQQRYAFYCGQSYKDAEVWDKSIEWYKKRIELGGWEQELYVSHYYVGNMLSLQGNINDAVSYWLAACEIGIERYEALSRAAKYYEDKGETFITMLLYDKVDVANIRPRSDYLFMNEELHNYQLLCEMLLFYASRNHYTRSIEILGVLLRRKESIGTHG